MQNELRGLAEDEFRGDKDFFAFAFFGIRCLRFRAKQAHFFRGNRRHLFAPLFDVSQWGLRLESVEGTIDANNAQSIGNIDPSMVEDVEQIDGRYFI